MTDINKDRLIVEALGECWHEWEWKYGNPLCLKCGSETGIDIALATWQGFGWWWERFLKKKWAKECIHDYLVSKHEWDEPDPWFVPFDFIGLGGRDFMAEWLEANPGKWRK